MTTVPVLLYHSVADAVDPRFAEWAVTPATFDAHMALLAEAGYAALTVSELAETVLSGHRPVQGTVAVTFDDGFADFHDAAWPILARHGLTATVYVTTGFVGTGAAWLGGLGEADRRLMSWDEVAAVDAAGIECGGHGHTHAQLDLVSAPHAREEVERSRAELSAVIGPVRSFAYPHGYHHRRVRRQVEAAGYASACAVGDGLAHVGGDRYAITRTIVREDTDLERVLAGAEPPLGRQSLRRTAWRLARRAGAERLRAVA